MTDLRTLFGVPVEPEPEPHLSPEILAARALFGGPPAPAPEPVPEPITGPIIPGQEKAPPPQNRTNTGSFLDRLFDN